MDKFIVTENYVAFNMRYVGAIEHKQNRVVITVLYLTGAKIEWTFLTCKSDEDARDRWKRLMGMLDQSEHMVVGSKHLEDTVRIERKQDEQIRAVTALAWP